jgi:RNA polymerase sigma-70 factor (ECF subfamily)
MALYARQRMGPRITGAETQDLVQEAFVRLIKQCAAGREPQDVPAWLFACVRNAAVDAIRSESRRRRREQLAARERADHEMSQAASAGLFRSPPGSVLDAADAERALASIAPELREVVTLRIWGNMTLVQVAAITGSPVSTVYDRYRTALELMRRNLEVPDVKSCRPR